MRRRFADLGDNQTDYEFLRKDYDTLNMDPRDAQSEFMGTEEVIDTRDEQLEFGIEEDNPVIISIEKAYMDKDMDFSSEVMSWMARGASAEDVRSHVMADVGINISIAESESIIDSLSRVLEATSIKNRRMIPLKSAAMDSFIKTADAKFKYKFANVYWKVKAIKDDSGKEDFYLVRVED